ncbi:MAG: Hsp20/alpha crystallin family protein [Deltaproteobacteria bacterium]|nr:Hsp20/alpha crystallin family protein [Deltaproteobacteria bacterium]
MAELSIWKIEEMNRLRRDMGRMFERVWDDFCMTPALPPAGGIDSIEILDREESLLLRARIPDIDPANLTVRVSEDRLTIRCASRTERRRGNDTVRKTEARYDAFVRRLRLPSRIVPEEASASYNEGVLEIVLPKRKTDPAREIEIRIA